MCVCVCGPIFLSSIWILLIPFSSSNPSFSASSSHTLFPSLCPLLFLPPMLVPPAPLPFFSYAAGSLHPIHLASTRDKHVVVDRRLGPGPEERYGEDRLTWVGPAPVPTSAETAAGSVSHSARWSRVEFSPLFIRCTHALCLASPWPPASCHSGTREN